MDNVEQFLIRCEAIRRHTSRNHSQHLSEMDRDLSSIEHSARTGATREQLFEQVNDTQLYAHADYDAPRGTYRAAMLSELVGMLLSDEDRREIEAMTERLIADLEATKPVDPMAAQWAAFDNLLAANEALYG